MVSGESTRVEGKLVTKGERENDEGKERVEKWRGRLTLMKRGKPVVSSGVYRSVLSCQVE